MFKSQTGRNKFLAIGISAMFFGVFAMASRAEAQTVRCENLFSGVKSQSPVWSNNADSFWLHSAQIATPAAYSESLMAEIGKPAAEEPIYRQLIAPALWHYARLSIETGPTSDRVTLLVNRITEDIARQNARTRVRRDDHIRPKAMTADERREAMAVGHYGLIEGSRPPSPKSEAQKRQDAIMELVRRAQHTRRDSEVADPSADLVRLEFDRINRQRVNDPSILKTEIDALLESPVDYAIVYAQVTGLVARAGDAGTLLTRFIPWGRPAAEPAKFRALADLVAMGRAANASLVDTRTADALVLETLRLAFAPHLPMIP